MHEATEYGVLEGAGDVSGRGNEGRGRQFRPRRVTGSVSLCGCEQPGCGFDVIERVLEETEIPFEKNLETHSRGLGLERATSLNESGTNVATQPASCKATAAKPVDSFVRLKVRTILKFCKSMAITNLPPPKCSVIILKRSL